MLPLPRRRAGRCCSSRARSSSHVGGASHGGRMFVENLRGHLRFLAKHRGPARGRAGAAAAARLAAAARGRVPRRARPDVPRGGRLARVGLGGVAAHRAAPVSWDRLPRELAVLPALLVVRWLPDSGFWLYLRLAAATLTVLLPGALVARALGGRSASATARLGLAGLVAAPGAIMFAVARLARRSRSCCAALGAARSSRCSAAASRVAAAGARWAWPRSASSSGSLLWHVAGTLDGDALFHLARVRKLVDFGRPAPADGRRVQGRRPASRATRSRSGTASSPSSRGSAASSRGGSCCTRRACSCPIAFVVAYEAGVAVFRIRGGRVRDAARARSRCSASRGGHGGAYVHARAAGDRGAAAARPGRDRALLLVRARGRRGRVAASRSRPAPSRSRSSTRRTRSSSLIPLAGYVVARSLLVRGRGAARAGRRCSRCSSPAAARVRSGCCRSSARPRSHDPSNARAGAEPAALQGQTRRLLAAQLPRSRPASFARTGVVAVAALICVPLAAFAAAAPLGRVRPRRHRDRARADARPALLHAPSPTSSRSRRRGAIVGFVPLAFAFAGGAAVLSRALGAGCCRSRSAPASASSSRGPGTSAASPADRGPGVPRLVRRDRRRARARRRSRCAPLASIGRGG